MSPSLTKALVLALAICTIAKAETFQGTADLGTVLQAYQRVAPEARAVPMIGAYTYAIVRRDAIVDVIATTRARLSKSYGIPVSIVTNDSGWDRRFDCQAFALAFALELRARLMTEMWHSYSEATRPAAFIVNYATRPGYGHAIVAVLTTEGLVFVDPVIGVVNVTSAQRASFYFQTI